MTVRVPVGVPANLKSPLFVSAAEAASPATSVTCSVTSLRTGASITPTASAFDDGTTTAVTGRYVATLPAYPMPDILTVAWVGTVDAATVTLTDTVRVVGSHYATVPEITGSANLVNKPLVSHARVAELRDAFASIASEYIGESMTLEYDVATVNPCRSLLLPHPACTLVTVADADDADVLIDWTVNGIGLLRSETSTSNAPYSFAYDHGWNQPDRLRQACVEWVSSVIMRTDGGSARDVIWQAPDGGARYSTPDWDAGRPTGMLDVDNVLNELRSQFGANEHIA